MFCVIQVERKWVGRAIGNKELIHNNFTAAGKTLCD